MAVRADQIELSAAAAVDIDRDRRLVLRHQQGDADAFDELYRRYHHRLVSYCARRVGDRHTAEELAQDAFVKALRAMPGFAGERRFYPWMTVIAQRLCIDHHRRHGRVEPAAEIDAGVVDADHDAVFAAVDRDHLADAMDRLAPRHREILELREQQGWSYHQIAEHLDVPMTTVEALLHRARKALRREFLSLSRDRFAGVAIGGGLLARLKSWWAGAGTTAAAGAVAAAVVSVPLSLGGSGLDVPSLRAPSTATVVAPVTTIAAVLPDPVLTTAPSTPAPPPPTPTTAAVPSPRTAAPAPPPAATAGPAAVYTGDEATAWAEAQNDAQPVQIPVGDVADVGLHPTQIVNDLLDPGEPE